MLRFIVLTVFLTITAKVNAESLETVIIEVEGDVAEHQKYIETYHPFIEVIASYSTIFNGLAIEGKPEHLAKMETVDFIKGMYEPQKYQALATPNSREQIYQQSYPQTGYSGKGVKVAVIDTGIDYTHPDLQGNYIQGFDVFDFDDDPMETLPEEGIPTNHGTHVSGIIAANGKLKGIAPNAEIYAYRALGPGGYGSTIHILAALEKAVLDDVDIINLSLGNQVNGPDYPTSAAVNQAAELGIPVVIANGNSGPGSWTVGAPATAAHALSIGAATEVTEIPFLYDSLEDKQIELLTMQGASEWNLKKDYPVIAVEEANESLQGKIALYQRGDRTFQELAIEAQEQGAVAVLIANNEEGPLHGMIENQDPSIDIPVAGITQAAGDWLHNKHGKYIDTIYEKRTTTIADFSSRGPVTVNWQIKPDILAPGTNIWSTVPGGYEAFDGTSMAAPYVSGAIALLKEAHPDWEVAKLFQALKTTANLIEEESEALAPSAQGHGLIQVDEAIKAPAVIYDAELHGGKITSRHQTRGFTIKIENLTENEQQYTFNMPRQQSGIRWKLPLSFNVKPNEIKSIELALSVNSAVIEEGVHEDYLQLVERTANKTYQLPYLFVNQEADQPKAAGFEWSMKRFSEDTYMYRVYVTEPLKTFTVDLYDPDTLIYKGRMINLETLATGMNEGEIASKNLTPGIYTAVLTAITEQGVIEKEETIISVE